MWVWKRIEKIICVDKVSNEKLINKIQKNRVHFYVFLQRNINWLGYFVRGRKILTTVLEGPVKWERRRKEEGMLRTRQLRGNLENKSGAGVTGDSGVRDRQ